MAECQAAAVAKYSRNFLPILFNLFVAAPPERRGELSATVGCFARHRQAASLGGFFRTVLRKLVKVTSDIEDAPDALTEGGDTRSARRCTFMDLSLAMVPGLMALRATWCSRRRDRRRRRRTPRCKRERTNSSRRS